MNFDNDCFGRNTGNNRFPHGAFQPVNADSAVSDVTDSLLAASFLGWQSFWVNRVCCQARDSSKYLATFGRADNKWNTSLYMISHG